MHGKIKQYILHWQRQGYSDGIPDEVPDELMRERLAPSYKAIACAIMQCDHGLQSLGFSIPSSPWYDVLKKIEISRRPIPIYGQIKLEL